MKNNELTPEEKKLEKELIRLGKKSKRKLKQVNDVTATIFIPLHPVHKTQEEKKRDNDDLN